MSNELIESYDLSIVIPFLNEEESLAELFSQIQAACQDFKYEVIGIDDGSTDQSWTVLNIFINKNPGVFKGIKFRRNVGKSAALNVGFQKAKGDVVITMDADLQDNPNEIPELYRMIKEDGFDLVSGWKKNRKDPAEKRIPSKLFNATTQMVSGVKLNDFNCGLKAYKKDVVKSVQLQGDMHRYIPVMAKRAGFSNIGEKVVAHRAREFGKSKFGAERYLNGFLDLMTVTFVSKFGKRPMHFFGTLGIIAFFLGFASGLILVIKKIIQISQKDYGKLITDSPWFYFALTLMIIGVQLFLAGYLGELISRQGQTDFSEYIEEES